MERKTFLTLLSGVIVAFLAGIKGAPKVHASPSVAPDPSKDFATGKVADDFLSTYEPIEVCGIPVYCDPYCPKDTVYIVGPRFTDIARSEHLDKPTAIQLIVGSHRMGTEPNMAVTHPDRWRELSDSVCQS